MINEQYDREIALEGLANAKDVEIVIFFYTVLTEQNTATIH